MISIFDEAGFEILPGILSSAECDALIIELSGIEKSERKSAGLRNLLRSSALVSDVAVCAKLNEHLQSRLGRPAFPVRALFFDKTQRANWRVSWHQDWMIAVG